MSLAAASVPEHQAITSEDAQGPIDVDDSADDHNSDFTHARNFDTTSLSSSVLDYQYENGRRYQNYREGYTLPNDKIEQDRLDMFHHVFTLILGGKLYTAPLDKPRRVLDIGTGTGGWAIDFADENEQAEVIGNDLSPIQPTWIPPNLHFEIDDAEQPWTYEKASFDYIHMRTLSGAFSDWHGVLRQCFEHLRPGGYLEVQDYGAELFHNSGETPNSAFSKWWTSVCDCAFKVGRPFIVAKYMKTWMEQAGFVDVHVRKEIWPFGPWPKDPTLRERGRWGLIAYIDSLEPFGLALLTRVGGLTPEEVHELCGNAKKDLLAKDNRYYNETWFIYGKRPEDSDLAAAERNQGKELRPCG